MSLLTETRHPSYDNYQKYRNVYESGDAFIDTYLEKFDQRETAESYKRRRNLTYCPAFCREGLDELRNNIFQRMPEIIRSGGTPSYQAAVAGKLGGVDLMSNTMNSFLGQEVLPELMAMGVVGIYVDMPRFNSRSTLADLTSNTHPYLYYYKRENIQNWRFEKINNEHIFTNLLLRESREVYGEFGLPIDCRDVWRHLILREGYVELNIYEQYQDNDILSERVIESYRLELTRIPFVLASIGDSLLKQIANYQIALLNMESADVAYSFGSNFPIYTEQYDPKNLGNNKAIAFDADGNEIKIAPEALELGNNKGRRYPIGAERPDFVNPSSEPLKISMEKQAQIKDDIRRLLNLAVSNVSPGHASAASKKIDQQGLESGLAAIGFELEGVETQIAQIWREYENQAGEEPTIAYPSNYSIKTEEERKKEVKDNQSLQGCAPSRLFMKELAKENVRLLFGNKLSQDKLKVIYQEIDDAKYVTGNSEEIERDLKAGLVTEVTASYARGYDGDDEVEQARVEHAMRAARILKAQTNPNLPARGLPDLGDQEPEIEKEEVDELSTKSS